jgi:hypothetical protein
VLALRNVICSDRWKEEWPKIEGKLRRQVRERQTELHRSRQVAAQPGEAPAPQPCVDPLILQHLEERLAQESQPKQAKPNPWRNFKHGKALYQRPDPPKI